MKNIIYILTVVLFFNCSSHKDRLLKNKINEEREKWIGVFKQKTFYECLKVSFTNDSIFKLIRKEDFFDSSDYLTFPVIDKIRSIAKEYKKKIPRWSDPYNDSTLSYRKPIFSYCLEYYISRELDSIAKSESEKIDYKEYYISVY